MSGCEAMQFMGWLASSDGSAQWHGDADLLCWAAQAHTTPSRLRRMARALVMASLAANAWTIGYGGTPVSTSGEFHQGLQFALETTPNESLLSEVRGPALLSSIAFRSLHVLEVRCD